MWLSAEVAKEKILPDIFLRQDSTYYCNASLALILISVCISVLTMIGCFTRCCMVGAPGNICAQELWTGEHNNCSDEEFHITLGWVLHPDFKWHSFVEVCVQLVDNGAHLKWEQMDGLVVTAYQIMLWAAQKSTYLIIWKNDNIPHTVCNLYNMLGTPCQSATTHQPHRTLGGALLVVNRHCEAVLPFHVKKGWDINHSANSSLQRRTLQQSV